MCMMAHKLFLLVLVGYSNAVFIYLQHDSVLYILDLKIQSSYKLYIYVSKEKVNKTTLLVSVHDKHL